VNEGLERGGLVGEDVFAADLSGLGIVKEESDLVLGVVMLPLLREV